jgi:2-dehydro-3-deoxyphosphogluconate aldolase / (4S)-4-hydroxy-2-oxoglutarate aldolase
MGIGGTADKAKRHKPLFRLALRPAGVWNMPMTNREKTVKSLIDGCLVAVIRTSKAEQVIPVCEACLEGGIQALEITLTTPNAIELIRTASARFGQSAIVGVGSVLTAERCRAAVDAGAQFVVSPIGKQEIAAAAHELDRPVMLGAYTPTEAQLAHEMGADFIKIFPADKLGPSYIKALRAPMPHLRIVPTGGVDLKTAADFLKAGCSALGVGSSLLAPDLLKAGDWKGLAALAAEFVKAVKAAKSA